MSFSGTTLNAANQVPNITASRVAVSDTNGDLTASSITTTELDFLDGVSSGIQSQLNAKQATITNSITAPSNQNFTINTSTSAGLGTTHSFLFKSDGDFVDGNNINLSNKQNSISVGSGLTLSSDTINLDFAPPNDNDATKSPSSAQVRSSIQGLDAITLRRTATSDLDMNSNEIVNVDDGHFLPINGIS